MMYWKCAVPHHDANNADCPWNNVESYLNPATAGILCSCKPLPKDEDDCDEMNHLERKFRELREAWFSNHLKFYAPEGVWESEEEEQHRENHNALIKAKYDQQTEHLIENPDSKCCVFPQCTADMD